MNQLMLNNAPQKIIEMKIGPSVHTRTFDTSVWVILAGKSKKVLCCLNTETEFL